MNKIIKSLISVLLVCLMLMPTGIFAFAEETTDSIITEDEYLATEGEIYPIVYVIGKVDTIYKVKGDKSSETVYPPSMDKMDTKVLTEELVPALSDALMGELSGDQSAADESWKEYGEALYKVVISMFQGLALDENGEASDGSGIAWEWPETPLYDTKKGGKYGLYDYTFHYDWRLDMFHNAEILDQYIDEVLEVTGAEKCVLISRCYGCNLVTTYLSEYGHDAVDNCILYCSTATGSIVCSEIFCGEINVNAEGLDYYLADLFGGKNPIKEAIGASRNELVGQIGTWSVNKILEKVGDDVIPRVLMETFGTMPGYWSMVDDEHYEAALDFAYGMDLNKWKKYEKLIEKTDFYHYTVQLRVEELLMEAFNDGVRYANITKYGSQLVPVIEGQDFLGDSIVEVERASLGATATKTNETFSESYIKNAAYDGFYISPEKQIDASTALIPDCTWFVKGVDHFSFPECVDELLLAIARYDGQMSIFAYGNFPQYLEFEDDENVLDYGSDKFLDSNSKLAVILKTVLSYIELIISFITSIFG